MDFKTIDEAEKDSSIYKWDVPKLLLARQVLDKDATCYAANKVGRVRWEVLHRLVCHLIAKLEAENIQTERNKQHASQMAEYEKLGNAIKGLQKPHWTLKPTFWITLAILAVGLLAWLFPVERQQKPIQGAIFGSSNSIAAPLLTNLQPAQPAAQQTSPPAIYGTPNTNRPAK